MTRQQMIRIQLVAQIDELLSHHANSLLHREIAALVAGPDGDRLAVDPYTGILAGLSYDEARSLGELVDALQRVDDGTYGRCTSCGEPIGEERLLETPAVALCVSCASEESWRPYNPG